MASERPKIALFQGPPGALPPDNSKLKNASLLVFPSGHFSGSNTALKEARVLYQKHKIIVVAGYLTGEQNRIGCRIVRDDGHVEDHSPDEILSGFRRAAEEMKIHGERLAKIADGLKGNLLPFPPTSLNQFVFQSTEEALASLEVSQQQIIDIHGPYRPTSIKGLGLGFCNGSIQEHLVPPMSLSLWVFHMKNIRGTVRSVPPSKQSIYRIISWARQINALNNMAAQEEFVCIILYQAETFQISAVLGFERDEVNVYAFLPPAAHGLLTISTWKPFLRLRLTKEEIEILDLADEPTFERIQDSFISVSPEGSKLVLRQDWEELETLTRQDLSGKHTKPLQARQDQHEGEGFTIPHRPASTKARNADSRSIDQDDIPRPPTAGIEPLNTRTL